MGIDGVVLEMIEGIYSMLMSYTERLFIKIAEFGENRLL